MHSLPDSMMSNCQLDHTEQTSVSKMLINGLKKINGILQLDTLTLDTLWPGDDACVFVRSRGGNIVLPYGH